MDYQKAIENIQLDRMSGDLTDEQADKAVEKIRQQECSECKAFDGLYCYSAGTCDLWED